MSAVKLSTFVRLSALETTPCIVLSQCETVVDIIAILEQRYPGYGICKVWATTQPGAVLIALNEPGRDLPLWLTSAATVFQNLPVRASQSNTATHASQYRGNAHLCLTVGDSSQGTLIPYCWPTTASEIVATFNTLVEPDISKTVAVVSTLAVNDDDEDDDEMSDDDSDMEQDSDDNDDDDGEGDDDDDGADDGDYGNVVVDEDDDWGHDNWSNARNDDCDYD